MHSVLAARPSMWYFLTVVKWIQVAVGAVTTTRTCCTGHFWAAFHAGGEGEFRRRALRIWIVHRRLYFEGKWGWAWRCTVQWTVTFAIPVHSARAAEATRAAGEPRQ